MCIPLCGTHLGMPGSHLCERWSKLGELGEYSDSNGKTILFEIDTPGLDLMTLPSLVHGVNRP